MYSMRAGEAFQTHVVGPAAIQTYVEELVGVFQTQVVGPMIMIVDFFCLCYFPYGCIDGCRKHTNQLFWIKGNSLRLLGVSVGYQKVSMGCMYYDPVCSQVVMRGVLSRCGVSYEVSYEKFFIAYKVFCYMGVHLSC